MAASTGGALKALIENAGLGLAAYRADDLPRDKNGRATVALPCVIIQEELVLVPAGIDNPYDNLNHSGVETVQVSLWQNARDPATNVASESFTLPKSLQRLLDGAQFATSGSGAPATRTWGVRFVSSRRIPESASGRVQHAMTIEVVRDL